MKELIMGSGRYGTGRPLRSTYGAYGAYGYNVGGSINKVVDTGDNIDRDEVGDSKHTEVTEEILEVTVQIETDEYTQKDRLDDLVDSYVDDALSNFF